MQATPAPQVLLKLTTVKARVGLNKTAIYAGIKKGWFPRPVKIGASSRWIESEIDALIAALKEHRDYGKA
jgi:prophage regulatory protein